MRVCFLPALALFALPLSAQLVGTTAVTSGTYSSSGGGTMHLSPRRFATPAVPGAPYSAKSVREQVQTGADGTRFTSTFQNETTYRDSQGRTRTERQLMMGAPSNVPESPQIVEISDPVAGYGYTLDIQNKVAHRYQFEAPPSRPAMVNAGGGGGGAVGTVFATGATAKRVAGPVPAMAGRPQPDITHEDLGAQMVEGVMAKGQRTVMTFPAGSQGNDRPFQVTSENWYSDELHMMVLTKSTDPRHGESTFKLTNISRNEPDAGLFAPPPDYTVVDDTGPFEIHWTVPRQQ